MSGDLMEHAEKETTVDQRAKTDGLAQVMPEDETAAMGRDAANSNRPARKRSRSARFLGGVGLGYSFQAISMLVGLWMTPFLLRHIGQHDLGVWMVGTQ